MGSVSIVHIVSLQLLCGGQDKNHCRRPGLAGALCPVRRHSCHHLLLRSGSRIRMPQKAESLNVTPSSTVCLVFLSTARLTHIRDVGADSYLCPLVSQKGCLVGHPPDLRPPLPAMRHIPKAGWEALLWLSIHVYLKKPVTKNLHRVQSQNKLLLNKG